MRTSSVARQRHIIKFGAAVLLCCQHFNSAQLERGRDCKMDVNVHVERRLQTDDLKATSLLRKTESEDLRANELAAVIR